VDKHSGCLNRLLKVKKLRLGQYHSQMNKFGSKHEADYRNMSSEVKEMVEEASGLGQAHSKGMHAYLAEDASTNEILHR
jgi:hypothetical protein